MKKLQKIWEIKKHSNKEWINIIAEKTNDLISHVESLEKAQEEDRKRIKKIADWLEIDKINIPPVHELCTCKEPRTCTNCGADYKNCLRCAKPLQDTGVREKIKSLILACLGGYILNFTYATQKSYELADKILALIKENHE
jgi:hypothetical protein